MGDLQDPYGAAAGLWPPAAAVAGGAGEAAEEEDMRDGEGQARRWQKRGRARWRKWAGAEPGLRAGEKMEARRVAICGVRALFYKVFAGFWSGAAGLKLIQRYLPTRACGISLSSSIK
jgi:hypothetical protein